MINHEFEVTKPNGEKVTVSAVSEAAVREQVKDAVDIRVDHFQPNQTHRDKKWRTKDK